MLAGSPTSIDDFLVDMQHTLIALQNEIRGNDTDAFRKYWREDGNPQDEHTCTQRLIEDIDRLQQCTGVTRIPEVSMPREKRADILYSSGKLSIPIECKGQWNSSLWTAAVRQLDTLYLRDSRTQGRGIYLIYWFGNDVDTNYRLKKPANGVNSPTSPAELKARLVESIPPDRRASLIVEVIDFSPKPAARRRKGKLRGVD